MKYILCEVTTNVPPRPLVWLDDASRATYEGYSIQLGDIVSVAGKTYEILGIEKEPGGDVYLNVKLVSSRVFVGKEEDVVDPIHWSAWP